MIDKSFKITVLLSSIVVLFYTLLKNIIDKNIVTPFLSTIKPNILIDIIFIGVLCLVLRKIYLNIKNRSHISAFQLLFSFIVIAFYLYTKCFQNYLFIGFTFFDSVKYFDIVMSYFLVPPISSIILFFKKKNSKESSTNNLYDDSPINDEAEDTLDRNYKAKRIANEIFQSKSSHSLGFGITGDWGSGKTSFINLLKKEISKHNQNNQFIIIDFNPWLNLGIESIIQEYFTTLRKAIRPYGEDIYKEIKGYSNSLLSLDKSNFAESFKGFLSMDSLFKESLSEEFKYLNGLLKKMDKKIVVFIDDFDRLQPEEIFELLKLIRNTGGFDNFIYVVAFDKSYLIESLENLKIPNPESFAEKIFFKEENLIPATQIQIRNFLKSALTTRFKNKKDDIETFFDRESIVFRNDNAFPIEHLRDAKRFLNSFINDFKEIENEVVFSDYFNLKLLKFKFYDIYIMLFLDRDRFLNNRGNYYGGGVARYHLKNRYENDDNSVLSHRMKDFNSSILGKYMLDEMGYDKEKIKKVAGIMNKLFEVDMAQVKSHLSIIFVQNYHKYFKDNLRLQDLSEIEFKNTMAKGFEEIQTQFSKWQENKLLELVRYRFYDLTIQEIDSREMYEKIVRSIFYLAKMETSDSFLGKHYYDYDYANLRDFISDRSDIISEKLYEGKKNELKNFILLVLKESDSPCLFESNLLNFVLNNSFNEDNFILTKIEIEELLLKYFKDYTKENDEENSIVWSLYHNCKTIVFDRNEHGQFIRKPVFIHGAQDHLIKFIESDPDSFLVNFVEPSPFYGRDANDDFIGVSNGVKENIFGSFEKFEQWLSKLDPKTLKRQTFFKDEFLNFYSKFKENNYEKIEYDFKTPCVVSKLDKYRSR